MIINILIRKSVLQLAVAMAVVFTIVPGLDTQAQDRQSQKTQEYLQQQEILKRTTTMRAYDSAVLLLEDGKYEQADTKFKYVLANLRSIPSDLAFNFGKNSFYLKQYRQSIDWLNKYIQLKGTNGQYSIEAVELKKQAEVEFVREKSRNAEQVQEVMSASYDLDCGPTGKVICTVCKGDHVVIKKGVFGGNEYKTCPYCNEQGILTCEEYNLLIRGQLKPKL